jgi:hypothetical protein
LLIIVPRAHGMSDRPAFENSLSYRSFYYSAGYFVSPSELELIDNKVPTDGAGTSTANSTFEHSVNPNYGGDGSKFFTPPTHVPIQLQARFSF